MAELQAFTDEQEAAFVKGFNNGYILEKHEPKLTKDLLQGISGKAVPYTDGLRLGSKQYQKEAFIEQAKGGQRGDKSHDNDGGHER